MAGQGHACIVLEPVQTGGCRAENRPHTHADAFGLARWQPIHLLQKQDIYAEAMTPQCSKYCNSPPLSAFCMAVRAACSACSPVEEMTDRLGIL